MVNVRGHGNRLSSWRREKKRSEKVLRKEKEENEDKHEVGEREVMNFLTVKSLNQTNQCSNPVRFNVFCYFLLGIVKLSHLTDHPFSKY